MSDEKKLVMKKFKDAMVLQFNNIYRTNVDDIGTWQKLCQILGIVPMPEGLKECRDVSCLTLSPT